MILTTEPLIKTCTLLRDKIYILKKSKLLITTDPKKCGKRLHFRYGNIQPVTAKNIVKFNTISFISFCNNKDNLFPIIKDIRYPLEKIKIPYLQEMPEHLPFTDFQTRRDITSIEEFHDINLNGFWFPKYKTQSQFYRVYCFSRYIIDYYSLDLKYNLCEKTLIPVNGLKENELAGLLQNATSKLINVLYYYIPYYPDYSTVFSFDVKISNEQVVFLDVDPSPVLDESLAEKYAYYFYRELYDK